MKEQACNHCETVLTNWDYRYWGKHFCRKCYDQLFKLGECTICHKKKMIFSELEAPICKKCQLIGKPCIRCNKVEYAPGKVTEDGPVCNSCSKYFREPKECEVCHKKRIDVSNRDMKDNGVKLICNGCYRKTLPICSKCHKQRNAFSYTIDSKKPICMICSQEQFRVCKQCKNEFPAGMGRICRDCGYRNTLSRKKKFAVAALSEYFNYIFDDFSEWLEQRRGIEFAATHVERYFPYFLELDVYAQGLGRIPIYNEIVAELTVAKTRQNLLVTVFLEDMGFIKIDARVKEEYANIDMIERYLNQFEEGALFQHMIDEYHKLLFEKLRVKRTSIRSIRLSMTPACKYLQYCAQLKLDSPTHIALEGYLWCYPGQKSAITGFVNFINLKYKINLHLQDIEHPVLQTPKESRQQLKQKFIDLLREPIMKETKREIFFKKSIEYLHEVYIPNNVCLSFKMIKKSKMGDHYIRFANEEFFLPLEVIAKLKM